MSEVLRDTVVPLYIQIAGDIKSKIERGEIPAQYQDSHRAGIEQRLRRQQDYDP